MKLPQEIERVRFQGTSYQEALRFSHEAMATVFEVFIIYDQAKYAHQAASEAFRELDRLELELSRFIENSDVSRINGLARNQSVTIGPDAFACIEKALDFSEMTGGAFDISFRSALKRGAPSTQGKRQKTAEPPLRLDESRHTVQLVADTAGIDLGGIGKGYAVDRMADLLQDWNVTPVLIHGGMSSVLAVEAPEGEKGWPLTLSHPQGKDQALSKIFLKDRAVSGSGIRKGRHIIDTATGQPQENRLAAWALAKDGVTSDALSTSFMIMTVEEIQAFCAAHQDIQALIVKKGGGENQVSRFGLWE